MLLLSVLRAGRERETFYKMYKRVPSDVFDKNTATIMDDYHRYFEANPAVDRIETEPFFSRFVLWHPKLSEENRAAYRGAIERAGKPLPQEQHDSLMRDLMDLRLATEVTRVLRDNEDGEIDNLHGVLEQLALDYRGDAGVTVKSFVTVDVNEMLEMEINEDGISFRLKCINDHCRGLRPGDFIIIAARPDKGKTTFLASELTYMASQLPEDRCIVWLNNEGLGARIYSRLWQAALGLTTSQMVALHQQGRLMEEYSKAICGDPYKIRVYDVHGMDTYEVEQILQRDMPALVVFDMIDNVKGFNGEARTDLVKEKMYQWARELGVKYECIVAATSQISVEGANERFPSDAALKDSKTGKQGTSDLTIMIGALDDPGYARMRFIGAPKNKLRREGSGELQQEVLYEPERARYTDLSMEPDE